MARDKLTPKQEAFVKDYLISGNASDSYKKCYDVSTMQPAVIYNEASELLKHHGISMRIAEHRDRQAKYNDRTVDGHLAKLEELRDAAHADGEYSPAINAEVSRGKCLGYYAEKLQVTGKDGESLNDQKVSKDVVIGMYEKLKREVEEELNAKNTGDKNKPA